MKIKLNFIDRTSEVIPGTREDFRTLVSNLADGSWIITPDNRAFNSRVIKSLVLIEDSREVKK